MSNNINKVELDTEYSNSKFLEMLGYKANTVTLNSGTYINPFEIVINNDTINREDIIAKFKEIYILHLKFATEHNGQKINLNDIREICEKNNFDITDEELLKLINDCEKTIQEE